MELSSPQRVPWRIKDEGHGTQLVSYVDAAAGGLPLPPLVTVFINTHLNLDVSTLIVPDIVEARDSSPPPAGARHYGMACKAHLGLASRSPPPSTTASGTLHD